ncbi:MAG TPA: rhomboid family intramembrane serine protease [Candidatus Avipropionibacterium avicola]|uniref:Rhomboid family intramembrane serine protease n=1 Tax=Candidatus Avipropionibacterium avicola TaxID=2840701 RepID=A0A9D1H169_9ACTN|nr:rhomboid family intramembrane serine protease [Candidatus Avipropionibacterium avicola]
MSITASPQLRRETMVRSLPPVVLVALMWISEGIDTLLGGALDAFGIRPREAEGLIGLVTAPFLHDGFAHLVANTSTFVVLGLLVAWLTRWFWLVTVGVAVLGGLGVWLFGAPLTVHVGASGLVYGYAAFLVAYGLVARRVTAVIVAVVVFLVYGSIVWGALPGEAGVSWEGHLFGAVAGVLLAVWCGRRDRKPVRRP